MRYKVIGKGSFPVDMLRFDESYPVDEIEALRLEEYITNWPETNKPFTVELETAKLHYNADRWNSFNWRVLT